MEALRHADLAEEAEIVPCDHNSKREKDDDLDHLAGLMDCEKHTAPFQLRARSQITNYERDDKSLAQDFVMVKAGCAWLAKWYLPDLETEKVRRSGKKRKPYQHEDDVYAGAGFVEDPYFSMPEAGLDSMDAATAMVAMDKE